MKTSDYKDKTFLRKYDKTPYLHPYVMFPALLKEFSNVKDKYILDLGCGSGTLSNELYKKGANVIGIDQSKQWIDFAKSKYSENKKLKFLTMDGSKLKFQDKKFDFVLMNMVLLNVENKKQLEKIFKEISKVLKPNGKLIFSDLHPLCLMVPKTTCEEQKYLKGFSYFKDKSMFESIATLSDKSKIKFTDVHWTLETYTLFLLRSKMYIEKIIEPLPIKSSPKWLIKDYKIPTYIIFVCKKLK